MKYLTVKIHIEGNVDGASVDYGSRQIDVEMPSKFDEEKLFEALLFKTRRIETLEAE